MSHIRAIPVGVFYARARPCQIDSPGMHPRSDPIGSVLSRHGHVARKKRPRVCKAEGKRKDSLIRPRTGRSRGQQIMGMSNILGPPLQYREAQVLKSRVGASSRKIHLWITFALVTREVDWVPFCVYPSERYCRLAFSLQIRDVFAGFRGFLPGISGGLTKSPSDSNGSHADAAVRRGQGRGGSLSLVPLRFRKYLLYMHGVFRRALKEIFRCKFRHHTRYVHFLFRFVSFGFTVDK